MPVEAYFLLYWNMADYVASLLYSVLGRTKRETWRKKNLKRLLLVDCWS